MSGFLEGWYLGTLSGGYELDLRIGRDAQGRFDCASGDLARDGDHRFSFTLEGDAIKDLPDGGFEGDVAVIGKTAPFVSIRVSPASFEARSAANVILTANRTERQGTLAWAGPALRKLRIDVDPLHGAPIPDPALFDGAAGTATLKSTLADAGIDAEIRLHPPEPTSPQMAEPSARISLAELHDRLEHHWTARADPDVKMRVHMMLCDRLAGSPGESTLGIMYDTKDQEGRFRSGDPATQRRGVAIFLGHPSLRETASGNPPRRDDIIFTMVHEIGHALNLPHAWDRDLGADDLTWMNYPHRYSGGAASFRVAFEASKGFHRTELRFLHHAPFLDITPGQSRFGERLSKFLSGAGAADLLGEEPCGRAILSIAPLKPHYSFGEPIFLAVEVANEGPGTLNVAKALDPSDGYLKLSIRQPAGQEVQFRSPATLCGKPRIRRLKTGQSLRFDGVLLSHSLDGALFAQPGQYRVEAEFSGVAGNTVRAATSLRVLYPSREEELFGLALWEDQALARIVWLRHPLVDRERWNGLVREKADLIPKDPANSAGSYVHYISALGWLSPHTRHDGRRHEPDRVKVREHLQFVHPAGLPSGVRRRRRSLGVG